MLTTAMGTSRHKLNSSKKTFINFHYFICISLEFSGLSTKVVSVVYRTAESISLKHVAGPTQVENRLHIFRGIRGWPTWLRGFDQGWDHPGENWVSFVRVSMSRRTRGPSLGLRHREARWIAQRKLRVVRQVWLNQIKHFLFAYGAVLTLDVWVLLKNFQQTIPIIHCTKNMVSHKYRLQFKKETRKKVQKSIKWDERKHGAGKLVSSFWLSWIHNCVFITLQEKHRFTKLSRWSPQVAKKWKPRDRYPCKYFMQTLQRQISHCQRTLTDIGGDVGEIPESVAEWEGTTPFLGETRLKASSSSEWILWRRSSRGVSVNRNNAI